MSLELFASELTRFLRSSSPEVLCITGKWGVGKTFAWNHYLSLAQSSKAVSLEKYAYVSLFGLNSLEDVRSAIFENTVDSSIINAKPDLKSLEGITEQIKGRARSVALLANLIPGPTRYVSSANRILYFTVKEQIVCLDDLERAGSGLDAKNIMGLVSNLKDQKSCKVVLLLNEEALTGINQRDFKEQLEKVADTVLRFEPTASEAAKIGLDRTTGFHAFLAENTQALGIVNIRVIKKIEAFCRRASEILAGFDIRVLKQAVHTISLAGYAKLQPEIAPPLDLIRRYNSMVELMKEQKSKEDPDRHHKSMLHAYGFNQADEFDSVIMDGVERGYFDGAAVQNAARKVEERIQHGDKSSSFENAWDFMRASFDDNEDEVLDALEESVRKNYGAISPANLSSTISLLKKFGRKQQAEEVLAVYVENRQEAPEFWNLNRNLFREYVTDPDVVAAFAKKYASVAPPAPDPAQLLISVGEKSGWNSEELQSIANLSAADYVCIFKSLRGPELRKAVKGGLLLRSVDDGPGKKIGYAVEEALKQIATENQLNAKRVSIFGVLVPDRTCDQEQSPAASPDSEKVEPE